MKPYLTSGPSSQFRMGDVCTGACEAGNCSATGTARGRQASSGAGRAGRPRGCHAEAGCGARAPCPVKSLSRPRVGPNHVASVHRVRGAPPAWRAQSARTGALPRGARRAPPAPRRRRCRCDRAWHCGVAAAAAHAPLAASASASAAWTTPAPRTPRLLLGPQRARGVTGHVAGARGHVAGAWGHAAGALCALRGLRSVFRAAVAPSPCPRRRPRARPSPHCGANTFDEDPAGRALLSTAARGCPSDSCGFACISVWGDPPPVRIFKVTLADRGPLISIDRQPASQFLLRL